MISFKYRYFYGMVVLKIMFCDQQIRTLQFKEMYLLFIDLNVLYIIYTLFLFIYLKKTNPI